MLDPIARAPSEGQKDLFIARTSQRPEAATGVALQIVPWTIRMRNLRDSNLFYHLDQCPQCIVLDVDR